MRPGKTALPLASVTSLRGADGPVARLTVVPGTGVSLLTSSTVALMTVSLLEARVAGEMYVTSRARRVESRFRVIVTVICL